MYFSIRCQLSDQTQNICCVSSDNWHLKNDAHCRLVISNTDKPAKKKHAKKLREIIKKYSMNIILSAAN